MLISKEDLARIDHLAADRKGDAEVEWLCQLAIKLARLKPTEADFPQEMALINNAASNAFPMRLIDRCFIEQVWELKGGRGIFDYMTSCETVEAFLFVRPYVRILTSLKASILEELGKGTFKVMGDEEEFGAGSIAEILVDLDGYGVRRKPYILPFRPSLSHIAFRPGTIEGEMVVPQNFGMFVARDTRIRISLETPAAIDGATVSTGIVMAKYTTKGMGYGRPLPVIPV